MTIAQLNALIALLRTVQTNDFILPKDHNDLVSVAKAVRDLLSTGPPPPSGTTIETKEFTITAGTFSDGETVLGTLDMPKIILGMSFQANMRTLGAYSECECSLRIQPENDDLVWTASFQDTGGVLRDFFDPFGGMPSNTNSFALPDPITTIQIVLSIYSYGNPTEIASGKVIVYYLP